MKEVGHDLASFPVERERVDLKTATPDATVVVLPEGVIVRDASLIARITVEDVEEADRQLVRTREDLRSTRREDSVARADPRSSERACPT
jgi:hypothetical protein